MHNTATLDRTALLIKDKKYGQARQQVAGDSTSVAIHVVARERLEVKHECALHIVHIVQFDIKNIRQFHMSQKSA